MLRNACPICKPCAYISVSASNARLIAVDKVHETLARSIQPENGGTGSDYQQNEAETQHQQKLLTDSQTSQHDTPPRVSNAPGSDYRRPPGSATEVRNLLTLPCRQD
jgi:hypothetical protein